MKDAFEMSKTLGKAFVLLLVLAPIGVILAAIIVWAA